MNALHATSSRTVLLTSGLAWSLLLAAGCATQEVPMTRADGNTAYTQGRYAEAIEAQRRIVELAPGRATYRYELGRSLRAAGQTGEAAEQLAIAHGLDPASEEIVREYAEALVELQRTDVLEEVLLNRARRSAFHGDYQLLGEYLDKAGDPDGAEQALLVAAELAGDDDEDPQRALGRFYEATNRPAEAATRWRMVRWFNAEDPEALASLSQTARPDDSIGPLRPLGRLGGE